MLEPQTIALIRVATAIAQGDEASLRERMTLARAAKVPAEWVEELLLQSLLNVGYPLTLMAFAVWREIAGPVAKAGEDLTHDRWALWKERGAKLCAEVYGRTYHKLLLNLRGLHPALEALVVVDAYGKVLSRPGLDAQRRELCTLAAIAMLTTPRQLHAHRRQRSAHLRLRPVRRLGDGAGDRPRPRGQCSAGGDRARPGALQHRRAPSAH